MKAIAYYAQSLDNSSADTMHDENNNQMTQEEQRHQTLSEISKVTSQGKVAAEGDDWKIFSLKNRLVVRVSTLERDALGRIAPIVFLIDRQVESEGERSVKRDLDLFLSIIHRTLDHSNFESVMLELELLQKKNPHPAFAETSSSLMHKILRWFIQLLFNRHL